MKPAAQRYEREPHKPKPQYQFEMGTKSLLAAFFALAIVCGLFFAFGYTIGEHTIPATFTLGAAKPPSARAMASPMAPGVQPPNPQQLGAAETNQTPATLTNASSSTGTMATPTGVDAPASVSPSNSSASQPTPTPTATATAANSAPNLAATRNIAPPAAGGLTKLPAPKTISSTTPTPANASGSQVFAVQVFAGTSSDAGSLASALQTRGYPASVISPASGSGNSLYRVEVGPYLTRAEAEAMRARLRADGYQAVLRIGQ